MNVNTERTERGAAAGWAAEAVDRVADQRAAGGRAGAVDLLVANVALWSADRLGVTDAEIEARRRPRPGLDRLLAVWDQEHPDPADHPGWRHELAEMAHPETTRALYRMAELAG